MPLSPPAELLTTPEIGYLAGLFVGQGVTKIRLTGGEPLVRGDVVPLMRRIGALKKADGAGLRELCVTTNGVGLERKVEGMVEAGLTGVNVSLDTLDAGVWARLTRRGEGGLEKVVRGLERVEAMNRMGAEMEVKVNCVVMRGVNEGEMGRFVEMGRERAVEVRFIEFMPFAGNGWGREGVVGFEEMVARVRREFPGLRRVEGVEAGGGKNATSKRFEVPGFRGKVGFVTSMTDGFCGGCNRLRITSEGNLKVCLFGNEEVSLRDVLRKGNGGKAIGEEEMEERMMRLGTGTGTGEIGSGDGDGETARELLEVIGRAVKGKKEKHAGMDLLQKMKNRPMILIGG